MNPLAAALLALVSPALMAGQTCDFVQLAQDAPDDRYAVAIPDPVGHPGDLVVTDLRTGLQWKRCPEGYSGLTCATVTAPTSMHWDAALAAAAASTFAGYDDWRLPNVSELASLMEIACDAPSINTAMFPQSDTSFWSSTSAPNNEAAPAPDWAYVVVFSSFSNMTGRGAKTGLDYAARLVRGGPAPATPGIFADGFEDSSP